MNAGSQNDPRDIPLERVKDQLKALARVKPPGGLRDRLLATVPHDAAGSDAPKPFPRWSQAARYIAVAAAIILVAAVLIRFLAPLSGQNRPVADINDRSTATSVTDQNSLRPLDINVCDSNASL
jgi:hypothetical protein